MSTLKLKELREKKKISQPKLARLTGLSPSYISELETGKKTNPSMTTIITLAEALKVPVTKLLEKKAS